MTGIGFSATGFQDKDFETTVDCIQRAGYTAIELDAAQLDLSGAAASSVVRERLERANLVAESLRVRGVVTREGLQHAEVLGVPLVACGLRSKEGEIEAFGLEVKTFQECARVAVDRGLKICIKAHVGSYVHDTPTMLEFIERVGSPAVGLMWDPSHLWRANEDPAETFAQVKDYVLATRLRDHKGRQKAVDPAELQIPSNGALNWARILKQLKAIQGLDILVIEINQMRDWSPERMRDLLTRARVSLEHLLARA
jgi:sugar phosphate isomerase/epimerase